MTVPVLAAFALLQSPPSAIPQMLFMYGAIFAIFYFVLIRPQQKQRKQAEERLKQLKKGDEIVTAGGIIAEVLHIAPVGKDGAVSMDDRVTIKSGDTRLLVERGRIAKVASSSTATA
ncbi:MAG: preprotein translocase subunit YajC [Gemmatimonadetes bacterium]|nr:preprotein translocase subunit YajC [Gemmatimonadota bacterium]